jgi:hypothetical protein
MKDVRENNEALADRTIRFPGLKLKQYFNK